MSAQDRIRWDEIYRARLGDAYPAPDPLLFEYTPPVPDDAAYRALDLACGLGQNGLWLASQNYTVDLMDISRVALSRARAEMAMRNLRNVNVLQMDLDNLQLEMSRYQVICVFRYLKRESFAQIRDALVPGGRVIYETFNLRYLEVVPQFNPDFLLQGDELAHAFAGWTLLLNKEDEHVTRFVAVKPDGTERAADDDTNADAEESSADESVLNVEW